MRSRRWFGVVAILFAVAIVPVAGIAGRSYHFERLNFVSSAPAPALNQPDAAGIPDLEAIVFSRSDGTRLAGWFVAPHNGATIILLHGTNADRASLLWEIRALANAQFGVFA